VIAAVGAGETPGIGSLVVHGDVIAADGIGGPEFPTVRAPDVNAIVVEGSATLAFDSFGPRINVGDFEVGVDAVLGGDVYGFGTFVVGGDFDPQFHISRVSNSTILRIGGNLLSTLSIDGDDYLEGQVIFNANNVEGHGWSSSSYIILGPVSESITLTPRPHYNQVSSSLGGGAVGNVPYNIHASECSPVNGDTACMEAHTEIWDTAPYERETIVLSHYGKVFDSLPSSGSIPLVVMRQPLSCPYGQPCPGDATEVSSSCTVAVGQGTNGREVWICMTPANSSTPVSFGSPYRFTITPRADGGTTDLRSDQTGLGTAPNVYSYTYMIDTLCD
jgi:hypothetical protein